MAVSAPLALLLVGLAAIVWATTIVVENAIAVARHHRVSDFFIGVVVLTLSLIGTYTSGYNLVDPLIALFFAILGYILKRLDIPSVPIVLGLVLGPIFEARMRQALGGAGGDLSVFVTRPISLGLIILMVITIGLVIFTQRRQEEAELPV